MMQVINKFLFLLSTLIVFSNTIVSAQQQDFASVRLGVGSMTLVDNKTFFNDYVPQFELTYGRSFEGRDTGWVRYLNAKYQLFTVTAFDQRDLNGFSDTSNNAFGNFFGFNYGLMLQILKAGKNNIYIVPGVGLGYDTKTFYDNFRNVFIGSHLNVNLRIELMHNVMLTENLCLSQSFRFYHYSNGAFYLPNRGINTLGYLIGLNLFFER